jgi:phenylpropionate dioxygenase-like ring-hydroxylating dioxygenase large terminal subunit
MNAVELTPATSRSTYVTTSTGRIVEVHHSSACETSCRDGYLVATTQGEVVGYVSQWGAKKWYFQAVTAPSTVGEYGEADQQVAGPSPCGS